MIECSHLSRWHGDVIAVNDLTVTLRPGLTSILGPNGSGKSTLLNLAVGLMRPSAGTIRVLGENPWDNPRLLGRIGYVPSGRSPWPEKSGLDCVERSAILCGLAGKSAEAARRAVQVVGLEADQGRASGGYSHGMTQRLKLAMAIVHDPEALILDEPLVGADPQSRQDLLAALQDMVRAGKSIAVATHILADVDDFGGDIMLLNHGRLLAHGPVPEVREMLDQVPRTVRIGTSDPRALGAELWSWDSVLSVEAGEDAVTVRTKAPAAFHAQLQQHGAKGAVTSITSPDDSVEAVFQHLVR